MNIKYEITESLACSVRDVVKQGLSHGMGTPVPGQMCVEAAVCFAMGLPHSDEPPCVGYAVRRAKICLNDKAWSSNEARAKGMLAVSIAQLGSNEIDQEQFLLIYSKRIIQRVLPEALKAAAKKNPKHADKLLEAALRCATEGTKESAQGARRAAYAAVDAAAAAAYDAAVDAAAAADAVAAAVAAVDAVDAYAADAYAYDAADAAAYAARSLQRVEIKDQMLSLAADCMLDALKELNSPGCKFLYLLED